MKDGEVTAVDRMKQGHLVFAAGADIVRAGERSRTCYTLFAGWAIRYHRLQSGARQILDVLLPGDSFALATALTGAEAFAVQTLTKAECCVLDGRQLMDLFEAHPQFAIGTLRTQLDNERRTHARLTMLGRLNADERVGYFLVETFERQLRRGLADGTRGPFPLRRADIADAVGLSKVHVMRALRTLRAQRLADVKDRDLLIPDPARLAAHAGYVPPAETNRAIL